MKNIIKIKIFIVIILLSFSSCISDNEKPEVIELYTMKVTYLNGDVDTVIVKSSDYMGKPKLHLDDGISYMYKDLIDGNNYDKIVGLRRIDVLSVK